jgi:spore maturation protein CgeB
MITEIRKAPLTLGFANVGYTKNITTIKGRDFEVPAFGGLYLTQQSTGILKYYEPDKEVFLYRNFSDCYNQILKIKNNKKLSDAVRLAGYRKALTYCTWRGRGRFLNKLLDDIFFKLY